MVLVTLTDGGVHIEVESNPFSLWLWRRSVFSETALHAIRGRTSDAGNIAACRPIMARSSVIAARSAIFAVVSVIFSLLFSEPAASSRLVGSFGSSLFQDNQGIVPSPVLGRATEAALDQSGREPGKQRSVTIKGIQLLIPDDVGILFSTNKVSHEQLLGLDVSLDRLDISLQKVEGRTIDRIILELRSEGLSGGPQRYERFLKYPSQGRVVGYLVYQADPGWSLYVSENGSAPSYFICDDKGAGIMANAPRICSIREVIPMRGKNGADELYLHYLINFPDLSMSFNIDQRIRAFLASLVRK